MRAALNLITLTDAQQAVADVNGDGDVNATDALMILRMALGMSN